VAAAPQIRYGSGGEAVHWYSPPNLCAYEILGKNGKWRAPTIRDAREHGFVPGVSSIVRQGASPALEKWKVRQGILSALTHPRVHEIKDYDELIAMIERDSQEQVRKAANRGKAIHAAIERYFESGIFDTDYAEYVAAVISKLAFLTGGEPGTWKTETVATHDFGYGGRIDLYSPDLGIVVDFKGKEFAEDDEIKAYPEQARQLAAYRAMVAPKARCINLFISRNVPGLVKSYEWNESDLVKAWDEFMCLLLLWQTKNSFKRTVGLVFQ
jgi:hypothetical protein